MRRTEIILPFTPRPWQVPLLDDPAARIVAVVHRRAGKSTGLMWRGIKRGLTHQRAHLPPARRRLKAEPVRIVHTLPQQVQWERTGLWDRLARGAASIEGAKVEKGQRRIVLPNGAVYQTGGLDNPDGWRGGYADEIIIDEYDDTAAEGLAVVVEPMLSDFEGVLLRSGTPKGYGRLKEAYDEAGVLPGHSRYLLTWRDTGEMSDAALERMRTEMTEEEFAQEFECSFDAPNSGAYYAKLMQAAETQGRICFCPADPLLEVVTAWDLGIGDSTAIWFVQQLGPQVRVIDYLEASGVGLDWYVREIARREYRYGEHLLPHDAAARELGTGKSREEMLREAKIGRLRVLARSDVDDGIQAVRRLLPRCVFAEATTVKGRKALWGYRREWDEQGQAFRPRPVHDWASHGADAFRTLAMGLRPSGSDAVHLPARAAAWDPYER